MSKKDYIPSKDTQLLDFSKNLTEYATSNFARWKVPAPGDDMTDLISTFEYCLGKTSLPNRGKVDVLEKNEAKKALEKALRTYIQGFLARNPNVSNIDREKMRLTIYDTIPTSVADPTGQAEAEISFPGRTQLCLRIKHIAGTPTDVKSNYGFRVYYGIFAQGATLPVSGKDLNQSRFTRKKMTLFTFQPEDTGKSAFFSIRYENSKGIAGPWGPMFSAVIP